MVCLLYQLQRLAHKNLNKIYNEMNTDVEGDVCVYFLRNLFLQCASLLKKICFMVIC